MEVRGNPEKPPSGRPSIARRSIGCDRASPCSNCVSARLDCTHSTVAPRAAPKQRLLISSQYEQKIDHVARDVEDIKHLLQKIDLSRDRDQPVAVSSGWDTKPEDDENGPKGPLPLRDHSAHVIDFVKAVVDAFPTQSGSNEVTTSLKSLIRSVEMADSSEPLPPGLDRDQVAMPRLEHVVNLIRWAKGHKTHMRVMWICRILPLETYENICRKVFFATSAYTDVDLIIVNGFLSYMFAEHAVIYGDEMSQGNCDLCRSNLGKLLQRLPLILPASMEAIAALTFGCLHCVEQSKATRSWAFISSALSHCQTLGYHRLRPVNNTNDSHRDTQERLFWTVFSYENELSLRLGRRSGIADQAITLLVDPDEPRSVKVSRIRRKAYQYLYSVSSIHELLETRIRWALELSEELRGLINQTRIEVSETSSLGQPNTDPLRLLYLRADLVCHSSLLVLILRALPAASGIGTDECIMVARDTLELHRECMDCVRECKDPLLVTKYITWAILHTPFVPFTILYTRAVQLLDREDLPRLDAFAASLKPSAGADTNLGLYELLCQSAWMYIDTNLRLNDFNQQQSLNFDSEILQGEGLDDTSLFGSGNWYYGNQLMSILDENVRF